MNPLFDKMLLLAVEESLNAPDAAASAGEAAASQGMSGWLIFLTVVAVIVLPFVIGQFLAQTLRMKEYATKFGLVLFALTLATAPFVTQVAQGNNPLSAIDLGIDLAGGTNMVFQVDRQEAEAVDKEVTPEVMDRMVAAVSRRVNPTGTEEVTVRKVGADRIEVIVPGADQEKVDRIKREITNLGNLEFAMLANDVDHADRIALADSLGDDVINVYQGNRLVAMWRSAGVDPQTGDPKPIDPSNRVHFRDVTRNGKPVREFLVVVDPDPARRITGRLLKSVRETISDSGPCVGFTFNARGGYLLQQLTARHQPREGAGYKGRLAILLNDEIHSAPTINAVIGAQGIIEGQFSQEQLDELINVLNAGALEVPLVKEPINEFTISPLLGIDVQRKGFTAIGIAAVAVFLVTLGYYLKSGFVADVCLALNILLVLGAMSLIDATFTLPGLAGLVLTIGMAVDANVLIFERMREERDRGSSLRMSIKNGFEKAFSTIFDANVTTLITAVVLYYIGTDQVKGFAVTLFIGILMSMFSALFVGRLIFDVAERKRWLTDLTMMNLVRSANFNFLGGRSMAAIASVVVIVVGLAAVSMRGADNLDIDFRGGSMVTFQFEPGSKPTSVDEVRDTLKAQFEGDLSLEQLTLQENGETRTLYRMRTIESNADKVSAQIKEAFSGSPYQLILQQVSYSGLEKLPEAPAATEEVSGNAPDLFAGGQQAVITLKQPMTAVAFSGVAAEALEGLGKYDDADELVAVESTGGASPSEKVNELRVKLSSVVSEEDAAATLAAIKAELEASPHFEEVNTFASSVANETQVAALTAMLFSLAAIVAYLWVRFQRVTFGLAAVVALVHDVLCVLGFLALAAYLSGNPVGSMLGLVDFKINLPIVAAFLTIVGYSLNDTIVVFDRIREVRGRNPALTSEMVNRSLNQTLSRTLLTSMTTLIVVLILYAMGGEGIHGFAFCLIAGILVGTYSSIYVASPVLLWLMNRERKTQSVATA